MKTISLVFALSVTLFASSCGGMFKGKKAAELGVADFHKLYNDGKLTEIYSAGHSMFKSATSEKEFLEYMGSSTPLVQKTRKTTHQNRQREPLQSHPSGYIATAEEAKKVCEALLAGKGNDHDGPTNLAEYGDIEAVPAMVAVLKRHPANPDGGAVCTRWHCLTALRKLTKSDVGNKTEGWENWWEERKKKQK